MFGRTIKKDLVLERVLSNGIKVKTTIKTEGSKHLILFEDGSMISTYHPESILDVHEEIETVEPEELMDAIESIERNGDVSDYLFNKALNKFQNLNN